MNHNFYELSKLLNEMGNVSMGIDAYESLPRRIVSKKKTKKIIKKI